MRGVWTPIDLGGFRLYEVRCRYRRFSNGREVFDVFTRIAFGRTPTDAAQRVKATWADHDQANVECSGFALNVFQPPSWRSDEPPEPGDPRFGRWQ